MAYIFFFLTPGQNQGSYLTSARFLDISDSKNVTTSIRCRKKTFTKSLGGGAWPPWPPPGYATGNHLLTKFNVNFFKRNLHCLLFQCVLELLSRAFGAEVVGPTSCCIPCNSHRILRRIEDMLFINYIKKDRTKRRLK